MDLYKNEKIMFRIDSIFNNFINIIIIFIIFYIFKLEVEQADFKIMIFTLFESVGILICTLL